MTDRPKIFLDALPWDARKRNTDWRYIRYALPRLAEWQPDLRFVTQRSPWVTLAGNVQAVRAAIGWRIGMPVGALSATTHRLAAGELRQSGANLIFAQHYPTNAGSVPVVWENAVIDPEMQLNYHVTQRALDAEIEAKRPLFSKAAYVQVFTEAERSRLARSFPEAADRFFAVPWFNPHLRACDSQLLDRHLGADPVRILFVGNNALRKGLPELLQAFTALPAPVLQRAQLTIISNFDRSPINVPTHPRIQVLHGATSHVVLQHMRESHVFVNVAHSESYGVVFHEAMSQGMVCVGPRWEVQREFFNGGTAGLNLRCDPTEIRIALEQLIEDEALRSRIAYAAWKRFQDVYAPEHAAAGYHKLFSHAMQRA